MKKYFVLIILNSFLLLTGCSIPLGAQQNNASQMPMAQDVYAMPAAGNDIIGQVYKIKAKKGETLVTLAQTYDIGAQELIDANPWLHSGRVPAGKTVIIPAEFILPPTNFRKGIVINIAEMRLYYFNNNSVMTFPIAVGREGWSTPLASTYVYRKGEAPTWHVPKSIRDDYFQKNGQEHPKEVAPGPDNPLGDYAIYLHMDGYLIHGNNAPETIGRRVSSGCIRMFNADVAKLYGYVHRGTPVHFIFYSNKAGWMNGQLYLESHLPLGQMPIDGNPANSATVNEAINTALQQQPGTTVDWRTVQKVLKRHSGIPTQIGVKTHG